MRKFLVQRKVEDRIVPQIMSEIQLINYINMADCHDELYEIFECDLRIGEVCKLHYKGWQPNCLIEIADEAGHIVLSGYGEDH